MAAEIILYCDILNRQLVTGLNQKGQVQLPTVYQGDALAIKFWPVYPTYAASPPYYSKVAITNMTMEVGVGPRAGSEDLYAYENTWAQVTDADASTGYLSGTLELNTTEMNTAVGTAEYLDTHIEFLLADNGVSRVAYQASLRVNAAVIGPTGAVSLPSSEDQYYTKAEMDSIFVKWLNDSTAARGKSIITYSPDGSHTRGSAGVDNNGSATDFTI